MKALFKRLPILLMAGAISVSCGSGDNSSGSPSSTNTGGGNTWTPGVTGTQGTSYQSIDQVRAAFQQKSFAEGTAVNYEYYHLGSYFGGSSGGFSLDFNFCWSDCQSQQMANAMEERIQYGSQIKVTAASVDSVSYDIATDVDVNNGYANFVYGTSGTMSRTGGLYKSMLGLNISESSLFGGSTEGIKVTPATISLQNGGTVVGQMVEFFIGQKSQYGCTLNDIKRYVVSSALPIIANPVLVIENGQAEGKLNEINGSSSIVSSVTVNGYNELNYQTCSIQAIQQQSTF